MLLRRERIITNRKPKVSFLNIHNMRELEWFRPPDYTATPDTSYGPFEGSYMVEESIVLLNLGSKLVRQMILKYTGLSEESFDPNMQYSGHEPNLKVHTAILKCEKFKHVDGTIISEIHTDEDMLDELEGPEEVVLFMDRARHKISLIRVDSYAHVVDET